MLSVKLSFINYILLSTRKYQANQLLKTSVPEPARSIPQKRRFASFGMVFEVSTVLQVCAVEKVFPPTCTIAGVKISWRQARNGPWEIQPEKPASMK